MQPPSPHRVGRLRVSVRAPDWAAAQSWRQAWAAGRSEHWQALIGQVLDRQAPVDHVCRLSRLTIDLRCDANAADGAGGDALDGALVEAVAAALVAALSQAGVPGLGAAAAPGVAAGAAGQAAADHRSAGAEGLANAWDAHADAAPDAEARMAARPGPKLAGQGVGVAASAPAAWLNEAGAADQALRHYLATGLLPWAWTTREAADREPRLRAAAEQLLGNLLGDEGRWPTRLAPRFGAALRWWALLDEAARRRWLHALEPWPAGWRGLTDGAQEQLARALWAWSCSVARAEQGPRAAALESPAARLVRTWPQPAEGAPAAWQTLRDALSAHLKPGGPPGRNVPLPAGASLAPVPAPALPRPPDAARHARVPQAAELSDDEALRLRVPLAGVVLLHPYLPRLCRGLGLLGDDGRQWRPGQRARAAVLLHALSGEGVVGQAPAEHQLPLIKLLLGADPSAPWEEPLPALAADDAAEADAVVEALRTHWTGLQGTPASGLRLSFLRRHGLLQAQEGAWHLAVMPEPFDLLLGRLPWAISMIRLPWMPRPLSVDWRAG